MFGVDTRQGGGKHEYCYVDNDKANSLILVAQLVVARVHNYP